MWTLAAGDSHADISEAAFAVASKIVTQQFSHGSLLIFVFYNFYFILCDVVPRLASLAKHNASLGVFD